MASLDAFIFGVDLDGVCADYTLGLQGSVSAHTGRRAPTFRSSATGTSPSGVSGRATSNTTIGVPSRPSACSVPSK